MSIHYDEKGKFYTDVISKKSVPVIIQTTTHRIEGQMHTRRKNRIMDELNESGPFLALTDVEIFDQSHKSISKIDFLAINRDQIIWVSPTLEEIESEE